MTCRPNEPGHELCPIMSRDRGQELLFITVPDGGKKLKNRLHFDLRPVDGTRDQEWNGCSRWARRRPVTSGGPTAGAGSP